MDVVAVIGWVVFILVVPLALVLLIGKMQKHGFRNNDNSAPPDAGD